MMTVESLYEQFRHALRQLNDAEKNYNAIDGTKDFTLIDAAIYRILAEESHLDDTIKLLKEYKEDIAV